MSYGRFGIVNMEWIVVINLMGFLLSVLVIMVCGVGCMVNVIIIISVMFVVLKILNIVC